MASSDRNLTVTIHNDAPAAARSLYSAICSFRKLLLAIYRSRYGWRRFFMLEWWRLLILVRLGFPTTGTHRTQHFQPLENP